jgi:hypothetical protein
MKIVTRSVMALFFAMAMNACGGGDDDPVPDAPPAGPDASTAASVSATATPTTVAAGGDVVVSVTATNFTLVDPATNTTDVAGEGHYHVYLDDVLTTYLVVGFDGQDTVTIPAATTVGAHVLKVQLQSNTHAPIAEAAVFDVPITVQ